VERSADVWVELADQQHTAECVCVHTRTHEQQTSWSLTSVNY